jgi:hypothetical protein
VPRQRKQQRGPRLLLCSCPRASQVREPRGDHRVAVGTGHCLEQHRSDAHHLRP